MCLRGTWPSPSAAPPLSQDDLAYAAAWLYRATKEAPFLAAAQGYLKRGQWDQNIYVSWDDVWVPAHLLLLGAGAPEVDGVESRSHVDEFLGAWQKGAVQPGGLAVRVQSALMAVGEERRSSPCSSLCSQLSLHAQRPHFAGTGGIEFSRRGMAFAPDLGGWGNLRYSGNAAFMMTLAARQAPQGSAARAAALRWATGQVGYILGSSGRSFVCGFGHNPPVRPHHAASSCKDRPAPCTWDDFDAPGAGRCMPGPRLLAPGRHNPAAWSPWSLTRCPPAACVCRAKPPGPHRRGGRRAHRRRRHLQR